MFAPALLVTAVFGQSPTIVGSEFECGTDPGDPVFWLMVEDASGMCGETGQGQFACTNLDGEESRADCAVGCELIQGYAGCFSASYVEWQAISQLPGGIPLTPNFSVVCPEVQDPPRPKETYDMEPVPGGKCEPVTDPNDKILGGKCTHETVVEGEAVLVVDAEVDCDIGCIKEVHPAKCKLR